jgi:hypothetical protein
MENISVHMRISGVTVTDDEVNSRRAAAGNLATTWQKVKTTASKISKAADVCHALGNDGTPSPELGNEIQVAVQKKSSAFLYEERPLEVSVCAGMALVSMLSADAVHASGWLIKDVYAAALWSALSYQPVLQAERREALRREVLEAAVSWSRRSAEKARERSNVLDPSAVTITIEPTSGVATSNANEAISGTIEALRRNAALDREELDFLWWAQLGRSRLLKRQQSSIAEPVRIIAAGIEAAQMLRRLPCEVHRELVLRTLDQDPELDLAEILASVDGDARALLCTGFSAGTVAAHPTVFPLLCALTTGEANGLGADVKRRVSEWGERALLEAGFAKMIAQGAVTL